MYYIYYIFIVESSPPCRQLPLLDLPSPHVSRSPVFASPYFAPTGKE